MLGFHITAYRFADPALRSHRGDSASLKEMLQAETGSQDVPESGDDDVRLAVWQTGLGGLGWLDALAARGEAAKTSHAGYPESYLIRCRELSHRIEQGLLEPGKPWMSSPGDTFGPGYLGTDTLFAHALEATDPDEWILVQAWDES